MKIKAHYRRGKLVSEHERKEPGACIMELIYRKCSYIKDNEFNQLRNDNIIHLNRKYYTNQPNLKEKLYTNDVDSKLYHSN
jgi:hypothetical protein